MYVCMYDVARFPG